MLPVHLAQRRGGGGLHQPRYPTSQRASNSGADRHFYPGPGLTHAGPHTETHAGNTERHTQARRSPGLGRPGGIQTKSVKDRHDLYLQRGKTGDQSRLIPAPPIRWSRGNMPGLPTPRQHSQPCRPASPPPCQRRDALARSLSQGCVPRVRSAYFSYTRREGPDPSNVMSCIQLGGPGRIPWLELLGPDATRDCDGEGGWGGRGRQGGRLRGPEARAAEGRRRPKRRRARPVRTGRTAKASRGHATAALGQRLGRQKPSRTACATRAARTGHHLHAGHRHAESRAKKTETHHRRGTQRTTRARRSAGARATVNRASFFFNSE